MIRCSALILLLQFFTSLLFAQISEAPPTYHLADTVQAKVLLEEAAKALKEKQYPAALTKIQTARAIYTSTIGANSLEVANTYWQEGFVKYYQNQIYEAIAHFQSSYDIKSSLLKRPSIDLASTAYTLGVVYKGSGEIKKAIRYIEESLELTIEVVGPVHLRVANTYNALASTYCDAGDRQKGIKVFLQAKNILVEIHDAEHESLVKIYNNLGNNYNQLGEYEMALSALLQAEKIIVRIGKDMQLLGNIRVTMGNIYTILSRYEEAKAQFTKAKEIYEDLAVTNTPQFASLLNDFGNFYHSIEKTDSAEVYWTKAYDIRKKIFKEDHPEIAISLYNLANIHKRKGDYAKSIAFYEEAHNVFSKLPDSSNVRAVQCLGGIALVHYEKGDYTKSIQFSLKAISMLGGYKTLDLANLNVNLSNAYKSIKDYKSAIFHHDQALAIYKEKLPGNHPHIAMIYHNKGNLYLGKGELEKAYVHFQKAIDIQKKNPVRTLDIANSYASIGAYYHNRGEYQTALSNHRKAVAIQQEKLGNKHQTVANSYDKIATTLAMSHKYEEAIGTLDLALKAVNFQELTTLDEVSAPMLLAKIFLHSGQINKAYYDSSKDTTFLRNGYRDFKKATQVLDYHMNTLSDPAQSNYLEFAHRLFTHRAKTSYELAQVHHHPKYFEEVYEFAERSKAIQLHQALQDAEALQMAGLPDSLLQAEHELRVEISYYEKRRQEIRNKGLDENSKSYQEVSSQLFDWQRKYEQLKANFEKDYPKYYRAKYDLSTLPLSFVQSKLLTPDQSLVEYLVGDSTIHIILVQTERFEVIEIPNDFSLEKAVELMTKHGIYGYYAAAASQRTPELEFSSIENYTAAAQLLYQKLIAPIASKLSEHVIIIPDGVLGYVPFETLLIEKPPKVGLFRRYPYLLRQHQISYCYSATLLQEMQVKPKREFIPKTLLAMAPFYRGDSRALELEFDHHMASLVLKDSLSLLPASGVEVSIINKLLEGDALYSEKATRSTFLEMASEYRIIHLSTHGQADDRMGDYAFLAFSHPNKVTTFEKLYARELYNLSLNADLVTLSACETGIGQLRTGEGIVSLARAFAYAGAKSIFTTLWKVSDEKTKDLMINFYRYLQLGQPKDEALQRAKIDFLKAHKGQMGEHPFFWAGLIGIGDMAGITGLIKK